MSETAVVIVAVLVAVVIVHAVVSQAVYGWRVRQLDAKNAAYRAARKEMFEREMGIVSDPDYKSEISSVDQEWAERDADYHPRRR